MKKLFSGLMVCIAMLVMFIPLASAGTVDTVVAFLDAFPTWLILLTTVVTAATGITMLTPTTADDKIINALLGLLNKLSGNVLKNKNKDDK